MRGSTVIKALVLLLAAVFIINQLVSSLYSPIKTESADFYVATEGVAINGFIIRNETPITNSQSGVMHYAVEDGSRVAKGGVIAEIYSTQQESINAAKAAAINAKIKDLKEILGYNAMEASNLELLNTNVNNAVNRLILESATGNFDSVNQNAVNLLSTINHRQAAMGFDTGFEAQLSALEAELAAITLTPKSDIKASQSGYFVSSTDGYEKVYGEVELSEITPEFMNSVKPEENSGKAIGKIVADYEWYIAATVSLNDSLTFKEGERVNILTSLKSAPSLSARVEKINISNSASSAAIIFACSEMSSELAEVRTAPMTVVKAQHEGLKVSKKALRFVESQQGVYVVTGMQINFVPVEILYFGEDFIICKKEAVNDKKVLKLYDNVIVKGKNLYDGKIVG